MNRALVLGMLVLVLGVVLDEAVTGYNLTTYSYMRVNDWGWRGESNPFAAWYTPLWVLSDVLVTVGLLCAGYLSTATANPWASRAMALVLSAMGMLKISGAASWGLLS